MMKILILLSVLTFAVLCVFLASNESQSFNQRTLLATADDDCEKEDIEPGYENLKSIADLVDKTNEKIDQVRKDLAKASGSKKDKLKAKKQKLQARLETIKSGSDIAIIGTLRASNAKLAADADCLSQLIVSVRNQLSDASCNTLACVQDMVTQIDPSVGESCALGINEDGQVDVADDDDDEDDDDCPSEQVVTLGFGTAVLVSEDVIKYQEKVLKYKKLKKEKPNKKAEYKKKIQAAKAQLADAREELLAQSDTPAKLKEQLKTSTDRLINKWACLKGLTTDYSVCINSASTIAMAKACPFSKTQAGQGNVNHVCQLGINEDGEIAIV